MGQIYRQAGRVLVWLGEADDNLDEAVRCMYRLCQFHLQNKTLVDMFDAGSRKTVDKNYRKMLTDCHVPDIDSSALAALKEFYCNAWFSRAWTFQESYLAQQTMVYQGWFEAPKALVAGAYLAIRVLADATGREELSDFAPHGRTGMMGAITMLLGSVKQNLGLRPLLQYRRGSGCQWPSDLVYSLLATTSDAADIMPDYALSFVQVFSNVTLTIMRIENSLDVLGDVDVVDKTCVSSIPSWVPDWRHHVRGDSSLSENTNRYSCAAKSTPVYSVSDDGRKLTVQGMHIDTIQILHTEMSKVKTMIELAWIYKAERDIGGPEQYQWLRIFRTLCCDLALDLLADSEANERWSKSTQGKLDAIIGNGTTLTDSFQSFFMELGLLNLDRIYMLSPANRYHGIVPKTAHVNDHVVMLLGCNVPVVLRETGIDGEFLFIGFCYVDGVMDGELIKKTEDSNTAGGLSAESGVNAGQVHPLRNFVLV